MMRTQFTFYGSFFKAVRRIRKASDRAAAYDAICAYALFGEEPDTEKLPDAAAIAFEFTQPILDASRRKAENGKRGGGSGKAQSKRSAEDSEEEAKGSKEEAKGSKEEANGKQEKEEDKEKEKDKEQMLSPVAPLSAVLSAYMSKINPQPSETCVAELKGFVLAMGQEVCMRAIDIALDERKTGWSYVRGILRAKQEQGVRCLADWDRLEEGRRRCGAVEGQTPAADPGGHGAKWNIRSALDDCD